jgi:thiol-disulfide isomerase/thioredoxin
MVVILACSAKAQSPIDTIPPYQKNKAMPEFRLLQTDSTWLTKKDLPTYEYTAIIYFSPECSHCQYEATEIVKKVDSLKNILFIWASYRDFEDIKKFYYKYKLNQFSNMKVGRDPKYLIPSFYQVKFTPFVALYNKQKEFLKAWDMGVEMPELIEFIYKK